MHHAIADGIAGVATVGAFLDPPPPPGAARTRAALDADAGADEVAPRGQASCAIQRSAGRFATLAHPGTMARRCLARGRNARDNRGRPLPVTSLDRRVGPDRTLALIRSNLEPVKQMAHASNATVMMSSDGNRRRTTQTPEQPREPVEQVLRIYVPLSLHREPRAQARGNLIGQMVVPLRIGVSDPVLRLRLIAMETAERKAGSRPSLGVVPHRGIAERAFLKLVDRQRVNLTSADIRGPGAAVLRRSAAGRGIPGGAADRKGVLAVAAMSYAGQFSIMVSPTASVPRHRIFVAGVQDELRALAARRSADTGQVAAHHEQRRHRRRR